MTSNLRLNMTSLIRCSTAF